jgi:hypothetical protein
MRRLLFVLFFLAALPASGVTTVASVITPDGQHRVEVCDCYRHQIFEIRARHEPGGNWYHVGANVPALQDVRNDLVVTNDRVVWVQGETASGSNFALRSSPIDVPNFSTVISHPHPQNGVGFDFPIKSTWGGQFVRYRSDPKVDEQYEWYVVALNGGRIYEEIFADGFENGGKARWQ